MVAIDCWSEGAQARRWGSSESGLCGLVVFVALAPSFSIHDGRPGRQGELTPLSMMTRWKVSAEEVVRARRSHQRQRSRGTAGIHVDGVVGEDSSPFPPRLPPIWLSSFDHQKGDDAGGSRHLAPYTSPEFLLVFTGPPRSLPRQIFNSELSGVLLPWGVFLGLPAQHRPVDAPFSLQPIWVPVANQDSAAVLPALACLPVDCQPPADLPIGQSNHQRAAS